MLQEGLIITEPFPFLVALVLRRITPPGREVLERFKGGVAVSSPEPASKPRISIPLLAFTVRVLLRA
jgi:hypothetical protein